MKHSLRKKECGCSMSSKELDVMHDHRRQFSQLLFLSFLSYESFSSGLRAWGDRYEIVNFHVPLYCRSEFLSKRNFKKIFRRSILFNSRKNADLLCMSGLP